MKVFTSVLFFGVFLVLTEMPENIFAVRRTIPPPGPHEEYQECGTWCENTCLDPHAEEGTCIYMCKEGNFCVRGYVRASNGGCILPSECPARGH